MKLIHRPITLRVPSTGSPEDHVRGRTNLELEDKELVAGMTRGLGWDPEPERFLAAAEHELAERKEHGVAFGWVEL